MKHQTLYPQYLAMDIHLRESTLFVRGFHISPLCGNIEFDDQLTIIPKDNNPDDHNVVKITNKKGVLVARVAREQSQGFRSMLRESVSLDIQVTASFVWAKEETITKTNGLRYQET